MVVVAAPAGEHHALPLAMLSDLLRLEGWEVADLGVDLPAASLVYLLSETPDAVAVGLSASSEQNLDTLGEMCRVVRSERPDLLIILGGGAVRGREHAVSLGADEWALTSEQMNGLIETHLARSRTQPT